MDMDICIMKGVHWYQVDDIVRLLKARELGRRLRKVSSLTLVCSLAIFRLCHSRRALKTGKTRKLRSENESNFSISPC